MKLPVDNFAAQLHDLHWGTSRLDRKPVLPQPLLDFLCKILEAAYFPPFREYVEKSYRAINAFRDALPPEVFEKHEPSLLTKAISFALPYKPFADVFRDKKFYPPYYFDFAERKPVFYRDEPYDAESKVDWRNAKRDFETFELDPWKEEKRIHEKRQKEQPELTPMQEVFLGTPFPTNLPEHWEYQVPFEIPQHLRFGHQFLVGASRSGKTTFLTAQLLADLKRVERGECSVIVMDSQNEFVPNISKLAVFGLGQPLCDNLIYLDPKEYPIAANIFSGDFRANYDNAEFFLNSIFKQDTSPQQTTMLKYAIQALTVIPNATVATLKELMEDGGYLKYKPYFAHLDPVVHEWVRDRMYSKDFSVSRTAIRNRLDGFLADSFFRAMFADPESKLDLFKELQTPKVILVNTADLGGALEPFGRFFIAKLDEAMQKRKNATKKLPVFCYIDEASDYIADEPLIATIIDKVGKQMLGMIISIQRKAFITSANVLDALEHVAIQTWTLKPPIATVRLVGEEPVDVNVQLVDLEKEPRMPHVEYELLRRMMKRRFSSQPLPRAEVAPPKPETKPKKPIHTKQPVDGDETDAKPW